MFMDMDVLAESEAPTRASSPPPLSTALAEYASAGQTNRTANRDKTDTAAPQTASADQDTTPEPPKKAGNLMKELKQNVQQGAMEFSMDSFDF